MKSILLACLVLTSVVHGSQLGLFTVKQPLYLHGSATDSEIFIADIVVGGGIVYPEGIFAAIALPYVPPAGVWNDPHDVNLASLYGIGVGATEKYTDPRALEVTIDATKARVPKGYPFTIEQVVDAVTTCVKMMHPIEPESERKFILKVLRSKSE